MKKCLLLLLLFVLVVLQKTNAQTPVAYYPFNGNANDAIGTLNGTVNGATLTTDRFGNANSAYSFDGVDDFIGTTGLAISQNQNWTISAWVKAASLSQSSFIVLNGLNTPTAGNGYSMIVINADNTGAGNIFKLHYPGAAVINSGFTFTDINTWHYVTITRDINAIGKMYFDGVLSATTTTASISPPGGDFRIGSGTGVGFWNGAIDEVKVYNNALTDAQVQAEYAATGQFPKPGSGNAISFDGVDDHITTTAYVVPTTGDFTVEFWVFNRSNTGFREFISQGASGDAFYIGLDASGTGSMRCGDNWQVTGAILPLNKWIHVSMTKAGTNATLYLNGMQVAAQTGYTISAAGTTTVIGKQYGGITEFPDASLDELRVWNTALTQSQIRDRMCRKVTATDALYSNLVAYYNFDESSGNTLFDGTANANNGALTNSPTRVTSGAAIGNASSHDYVNATKTASLTHPTGESFTVTSSSGNPDGIHVYRVDEKPSDLTGATGVGANDKYFGVFQVNGTTPQYTAVYNYNGNPTINAGNESPLRLNKRTDNAATSWSTMAAIPNEAANTITVTGESTEYILGSIGNPLPLNLISFAGTKTNNNALLQWRTASEVNVSRFELQRSDNGQNFVSIGTVSAGGNNYSYTDAGVFNSKQTVYYRLKSVDIDGRFTQSSIIRLQKTIGGVATVFPNPVTDRIAISGLQQTGTVSLYDASGKLLLQQIVTAQTVTMDLSGYAKGMYLLQYAVEGEISNLKIIRQ